MQARSLMLHDALLAAGKFITTEEDIITCNVHIQHTISRKKNGEKYVNIKLSREKLSAKVLSAFSKYTYL